jgi:hypothetical protein
MRRILHVLPILMAALSCPAFSAQAELPKPAARHIIQVFRSGNGQPREREVSSARSFSLRGLAQGEAAGRTRPYTVAQPGEGLPKN